MKVLTHNLTKHALNWAVAKAEGHPAYVLLDRTPGWRMPMDVLVRARFAEDWSQGGPIIEREGIQWIKLNGGIEAWSHWDFLAWLRDWDGAHRMPVGAGFGRHETSILIAAMRCFVFSKLGEEVDVPKELL